MSLANRVLADGNWIRAFTITDSATPTLGETAALNLSANVLTTTVTRQDTGQYDVSVEHVEDTDTLQTYLEANISVTTSTAIEELLFEDGTREAAATSSNQTQVLLVRGGAVGGNAAVNGRKIGVFNVRLSNTSGGWSQAGETYNRVSLEFEGYKSSGAYTVPSGYFDSLMTTPEQVVVSSSTPYGVVVYN